MDDRHTPAQQPVQCASEGRVGFGHGVEHPLEHPGHVVEIGNPLLDLGLVNQRVETELLRSVDRLPSRPVVPAQYKVEPDELDQLNITEQLLERLDLVASTRQAHE